MHEIPDRVWPADRLDRFEMELVALRTEEDGVPPASMLEADRVFARSTVSLCKEDFDLILLYMRGVDISCHFHWRAFETDAFPSLDPAQLEKERELIAREYELVDRTLGEPLLASGSDVNIIVMSDHGFDATDGETTHIRLNLDAVLERLGFLTMVDGGVDFGRSKLYSYASPERSLVKKIRFSMAGREDGGQVQGDERLAIRRELERALETATYSGGSPAFLVRDTTPKEMRQGAYFSVEVLLDGASKPLMVAGAPLGAAIRSLNRLSGTHGRKTPGIFIAAGPDFDNGAAPQDLRVIDFPPTVLYALGLHVGEDFPGRARIDLFTDSFRNSHGLQTIPTWGSRTAEGGRASAVDEELVDQLKALGYIE